MLIEKANGALPSIAMHQIRKVIDLEAELKLAHSRASLTFRIERDKAIWDFVDWSKYDNDSIILWDIRNVTMPCSIPMQECNEQPLANIVVNTAQHWGVGIQLCGWLLV